jgi:3D (Asp-Asp-Asp) domain-containing protein
MSSTVYTAAKAMGLAAALSVPFSDITITGFTVDARRLSAAVRQLTDTVSVTTVFTIQVADETIAATLSTAIAGAAADIKTATDSAMAAADWSNESFITAGPTMSTPVVATPVVVVVLALPTTTTFASTPDSDDTSGAWTCSLTLAVVLLVMAQQ